MKRVEMIINSFSELVSFETEISNEWETTVSLSEKQAIVRLKIEARPRFSRGNY